jgi:hypothetical protein
MIVSVRAGARDTDLLRLREHIAEDIRAGASPAEAASIRMQSLMMSVHRDPAVSRSRGTGVPNP